MHELSIVTYVIDQLKEIAEQNDLKDVESVTPNSAKFPELYRNTWWIAGRGMQKTPLIQNSKLLYETIPAVTWCNACKTTYPTIQYGKKSALIVAVRKPGCSRGTMNIKQIVAC